MVGDECNIQHEPNGTNRWSEVGNTPIIKVNRARDKKHKISVFGALSTTTGKVLTMFCPWLNYETAIQFLERVKAYRNRLLKNLKSKPLPVLLIWDNASFHKKKEVRQWLVDNPGVVELMNFPTYCPELNSQEHVWKAMKRRLAELKTYSMAFPEIVVAAEKFLKRTFRYKLL